MGRAAEILNLHRAFSQLQILAAYNIQDAMCSVQYEGGRMHVNTCEPS